MESSRPERASLATSKAVEWTSVAIYCDDTQDVAHEGRIVWGNKEYGARERCMHE